MSKEAVIYARVSSERQEKEGHSIPAQRERLMQYAERQGFHITQEFIEVETAGKIGRDQFNKMMRALKLKTSPKTVLVETTDRLTRNYHDMLVVDDLVNQYGVEFHVIRENTVIGPGMSTSEKLMWGIRVTLAKHYIDNLRDEISKGIGQKVTSGGWCWKAPAGYRMLKGRLQVDEDRAPFIRKLFELRASGLYSLEGLADEMYKQGFIYQPSRPRVTKTALQKMLENRLYCGEVEYRGEVYPGQHQAIIPKALWLQAQTSGKKAFTSHDKSFMFRGLLTCGACGATLSGEEKKGGRYVYYRCAQAANRKCDERYISESELKQIVTAHIQRMTFPAGYKEQVLAVIQDMDTTKAATANEEKARHEKRLAQLKEGLKKAYWDKAQGIITTELYLELQADYQAQVDVIHVALTKIDQAEVPYYQLALEYLELPEMLADTWISGSREEKTRLVRLLHSNFLVKDKKAVVELNSPFDSLYKDRVFSKKGGKWSIGDSNS